MVQKKLKLYNLQLFIKYLILSVVLKVQVNGNKQTIELVLKQSLSLIKKLVRRNPSFIVFEAFKKMKPYCELKALKVGGKVFRIPVEIKSIRQKTLAIKWLIISFIKRNEFFTEVKLSKELLDTYKLSSNSIDLCENYHKIAEVNKIYLQYRF